MASRSCQWPYTIAYHTGTFVSSAALWIWTQEHPTTTKESPQVKKRLRPEHCLKPILKLRRS